MKTKKYYILSFLAIIFVVVGTYVTLQIYFSSDPPMGESATSDPNDYLKVNRYIKHLLKTDYKNILPTKIPLDCNPEYQYSYKCNFDGDLYFSIYLGLEFDSQEDYLVEIDSFKKNVSDAIIKYSQGKRYYIYELAGIENYFGNDEKSYTGYFAAFIVTDDSEKTIQYIIVNQFNNRNKLSDTVSELMDSLKNLE